MKEKAYIHIYTGHGKGKTTSCIGLIIRSLGAGHKVFFCQFLKNGEYSEIRALRKIERMAFPGQLEIHQYGVAGRFLQKPNDEDKAAAVAGLKEAMTAAESGSYDLVILDEVNIALHYNLVEEDDLLRLMANRHEGTELVLSGRHAADKIIEKADLVSVIDPVKHYGDTGVPPRAGIEM